MTEFSPFFIYLRSNHNFLKSLIMSIKAKQSYKFIQFMYQVFLPILIGGSLYIAFRSKSIRLFDWFERIGLTESLHGFRSIIIPYKKDIPSWLYYSLPDGLWVYAFASALMIYWNQEIEKVKYWLLVPIVSGVFIEIAQGLKLLQGTFDFLDLAFTILALILSVTINYNLKQNEGQVF